jgi:DNA-binding response OmpR family regulator
MGSILLVEAEPEQHDRLAVAVREAGHEVLAAVTAPEAFSRTSEGGIDLIVVDGDPLVATELARSLQTLPDPPPIVLVSSSPTAPEISARIGAAAFLPKPFEVQELVAIIARHVEPRPGRMFAEFGDEEPTDLVRNI